MRGALFFALEAIRVSLSAFFRLYEALIIRVTENCTQHIYYCCKVLLLPLPGVNGTHGPRNSKWRSSYLNPPNMLTVVTVKSFVVVVDVEINV
jgi:hypothetical protein